MSGPISDWSFILSLKNNHSRDLNFKCYNQFQRPWDFWPKFRSIYWMKWETRFSRLNLIIGLIFPVGKKRPIRKKNSVLFTTSLRFSFFFFFFYNYQQNISYKPYSILRHQLLCLPIWLPESNKSDRNRTGDSMGRLASLNSIPPTCRSFVLFFIQINQYGLYSKILPFISFLSCRDFGHRASLDSLTMLILRCSNFW